MPLRPDPGVTCGEMRGLYDYAAWILSGGNGEVQKVGPARNRKPSLMLLATFPSSGGKVESPGPCGPIRLSESALTQCTALFNDLHWRTRCE